MVKGTVFYNPKDKEGKEIEKICNQKRNCSFTFMDATSKDISSYLYQDMRINTLPALYLYYRRSYKVFQGSEKIKSFLATI